MLLPALVAIGVIAGYRYYQKMNRTQANLVVIPYAKIPSASISGFTLTLDVNLKNPSSGSFSIKYPYVQVSYEGTVLASSRVINKDIIIGANDEAWIKEIKLDIPLLNLFSVGAMVLSDLNSGKAVKLAIKTVTEINLGWTKLPYEDSKQIPVSKQKSISK